MIHIPESKGHVMNQRKIAQVLQLCIEVKTKFIFQFLIFKTHAVTKRKLAALCIQLIKQIARQLVICRKRIEHICARYGLDSFLKRHNCAVLLVVVLVSNNGVFIFIA